MDQTAPTDDTATQADVDAAIQRFNDSVAARQNAAPVNPNATQADVDAAIQRFNDSVAARQGPVANPAAAVTAAPAAPKSLDYIAGQGEIGLAQAGQNIAAGNNADLMSMGIMSNPADPTVSTQPASTAIPTAEANKAVYGGNGVVVPPGPVSRYLGAGANAFASNPFASLAGGPGTIIAGTLGALGGGAGALAGGDLVPAGWQGAGGWRGTVASLAPVVGGLVGGGVAGAVPSAVIGPVARGVESAVLGTPGAAAAETLSLGKQYGVDLRATQVPGASSVLSGVNNGLQYTPLSAVGREVQPVMDQWHQAINKAIGAAPSSQITTEGLANAQTANQAIIHRAEQTPIDFSKDFNGGPSLMDTTQAAVPALSPAERAMLPNIDRALGGAQTYGDAIDTLNNIGAVSSSPAISTLAGQLKDQIRDTLAGRLSDAAPDDPSPYSVALANQENLNVVRQMPRTNGQINPATFSQAVDRAGPGVMQRDGDFPELGDRLGDLAKIGSSIPIPVAARSALVRKGISTAGTVAEAGLALAAHDPYAAAGLAAVPFAAGLAGRSLQSYISSQRIANLLGAKAAALSPYPLYNYSPSASLVSPSAAGAGIGGVQGVGAGINQLQPR